MSHPFQPEAPGFFPKTRWSQVQAAAGQPNADAQAALEYLCQAYWQPLFVFARRSGLTSPDAQDLTQDFFRCLLEKRWLETADPAKGRLRTFLISLFKRFLGKEWRRAAAQRRGGGQPVVPLDTELLEKQPDLGGGELPPDLAFDRQWAVLLLHRTMDRLREDYTRAGQGGDFAVLKECLLADRGSLDYPAMAAGLGQTEGAARVAAHRLRKRFRMIYREEITATVSDPSEVEAELKYLAGILAKD